MPQYVFFCSIYYCILNVNTFLFEKLKWFFRIISQKIFVWILNWSLMDFFTMYRWNMVFWLSLAAIVLYTAIYTIFLFYFSEVFLFINFVDSVMIHWFTPEFIIQNNLLNYFILNMQIIAICLLLYLCSIKYLLLR